MTVKLQSEVFRKEEKYKDLVYQQLDAMVEYADGDEKRQQKYVLSGAFEDQDAFAAHSAFHRAGKKKQSAEQLRAALYKRPYFAHMELRDDDTEETEHMYLSDCVELQEAIPIGSGGGMLLPFRKDKNRPASGIFFSCYQSRNGRPLSCCVKTSDGEERHTIRPVRICDDEIENRKLLSATQLFPDTMTASLSTASSMIS